MIICRKCQRHHPDSARTTTCPCGADLVRDGIALVQSFEPPPEPDDDLPALDDAADPGADLPALDADDRDPDADRTRPEVPPEDEGPASATPTEGSAAGAAAASRLQGRRRRARSIDPRELIARKDPEAPNVGSPPPDASAMPRPPPSGPGTAPSAAPLGAASAASAASAAGGAPRPDAAGTVAAGSPGTAAPGAAGGSSVPPGAGAGAAGAGGSQILGGPVGAGAGTAAGAGAAVTEPLPPLAGPGERLCPACGEPNGDTRRFCVSCGAKLPAAAPGDQADPADRDRPAGRRPRTWRQRARAASRGPLRYTEGFSAQVKARAVMAVLALVAGVVALAGPARERALALVGWGPSGQAPVSAELITGQGESGEEVAGFAAANVYDDDRETGVAIVWEPATGAEPQRIRVTLEEPVDVRKLQIAPGLADEAEDAPLVLKPSRIRVCANTGACQEISLDGSASLQTHRVDLGEDVETIDLAVLDVQDTEVTTYPLAVISEIRVV